MTCALALRTLAILATLLPALRPYAGQDRASFEEVMRRVHTYVSVYEDHELSTVIANERYHQQWRDSDANIKAERTMLSDYLLLQLPNEDWVALRDVYLVDGTAVAHRQARLETLLTGPRDQLGERAMKMQEDCAAFNLGDMYYRTVNLPTFALRVLRPANRKRIEFRRAGEEQLDGVRSWIIAFREAKGPTFSTTPDGADVPAHGRFWVDPDTGVVLRSEMILGGTRRVSARATVTVIYALEPSLGFRVPVTMDERYDNPRRTKDDVVVAAATYSDFRPFDTRR